MEKEVSASVSGIQSLLGVGRQSLLRTKDIVFKPRSIIDYSTRINGMSLPDRSNSTLQHNIGKFVFIKIFFQSILKKHTGCNALHILMNICIR